MWGVIISALTNSQITKAILDKKPILVRWGVDFSPLPTPAPAVTLAIGGHDPSGGAGIQADIEAIAAQGGHAASAITCLTVQDTRDVRQLIPTDPELVIAQAEAVLADLPVAAIKIGLLGDAAIARRLARLLGQHPAIPVVLDPVLAAGGGTPLTGDELRNTLVAELLPRTGLLTPNSREARLLAGADDLGDCARILLEGGCRHVLITGAHEQGAPVINRLYGPAGLIESWRWERLPGEYHGSGCTLAAAIAALLAQGLDLADAVRTGQEFAWRSLAGAHRLGRGQRLPDRLYRLRHGNSG